MLNKKLYNMEQQKNVTHRNKRKEIINRKRPRDDSDVGIIRQKILNKYVKMLKGLVERWTMCM